MAKKNPLEILDQTSINEEINKSTNKNNNTNIYILEFNWM